MYLELSVYLCQAIFWFLMFSLYSLFIFSFIFQVVFLFLLPVFVSNILKSFFPCDLIKPNITKSKYT